MNRSWIVFSLFLLALSGPVGAAGPAVDPIWVEPRVYQAAKASHFSTLKSEQSRHHGAQIRLAPMAPGDIEKRLQARSSGAERIGFWRPVADLATFSQAFRAMDWSRSADGGSLGHVQIEAPGASALRVGLLFSGLPAAAELRFHGPDSDPAEVIRGGDILALQQMNLEGGASLAEAEVYWSPVITGDSVGLEFYLPPNVPLDQLQFSVAGLSHLTVDPSGQGRSGLQEKAAAACNLDSRCYADWSATSNAVARITFVEGGFSYLCTGTLLNNTGQSDTPYFLTANHCMSTQLAASSLSAFWFYYSSSCNSGTPYSGITTTGGGARLLYNAASTDAAFLLLNNLPPSGVTFSGWTNTTPVLGVPATGLHNPTGDLQKISFGTTEEYLNCRDAGNRSFTCNGANQSAADFINIPFASGVTEGGSSGSGIFLDNNRYLFGQLYGGSSSCSNPSGSNIYGLFSKTYADGQLGQWLVTKSAQTVTLTVPPTLVVNQTALVSASASSGLPVSLSSTTPATCSVADTRVKGLAAGLCVIRGVQAGDEVYGSAVSSASLTVVKADQTVTVTVPPTVVVNQSVAITAEASSGLPVTLASMTPETCSVADSQVTGLATGLCVIKGSQAGNDAYQDAESSASLTVVGMDQTLTFVGPAAVTWGSSVPVSVTSSSGLAVVLLSKTPATCLVTGTVLQGLYPGDCLIESMQAGNSMYRPATLETNLGVVMPAYPAPTRPLSVKVVGDGQVRSDPVGIACGEWCEFRFSRHSRVELLASPAEGKRFLGWRGACTGKKLTCSVKMNAMKSVKARFDR